MSSPAQGSAHSVLRIPSDVRPLGPLLDTALEGGTSQVPGLKRKRGVPAVDHDLEGSFTILVNSLEVPKQSIHYVLTGIAQNSAEAANDALTLVPRLLIPRSCLPLACLDLGVRSDQAGLSPSRLFSARVKSLEILDVPTPQIIQPNILILEHLASHRYFAVESVRNGIYALCRLSDWITLKDFGAGPTKFRKTSRGTSVTDVAEEKPWWVAACSTIKRNSRSLGYSDGAACRNPRINLRPAQETTKSRSYFPCVGLPDRAEQPLSEVSPGVGLHECEAFPSNGSMDLLGMIRAQYLEALYIHKVFIRNHTVISPLTLPKTSLAYFAKGPLSRARASTQSDLASGGAVVLSQILRETILSVSLNDKKYNDSLPILLKDLPVGTTSEDEDGLLGDQIRKSKKRKKISKEGLFPGEEEYLVKWWLQRERMTLVDGPGVNLEERLRVSLIEQRARETQLQLILILEVLALESAAAAVPTNLELEIVGSNSTIIGKQVQTKKSKKPQNFEVQIDILIDRLCIWHSTSQEELKALHNSQERSKPSSSTSNGDHLRDFCIEVVVPFYATRIPAELYRSVCQKLGGPLVPSPTRHPLYRAPASGRTISKNALGAHTVNSKSRQPLERVLTDSKVARPKPHPALMRSATDSQLPGIKRELSELSLSAIPQSRPSLQSSKRYSQREVDLTAVSQATEAKLQRKTAIELELQGAIAALKKPNPRMAVKELVESADRRLVGASKSRKSKNPVRNPFGQGVQVTATPRNNRLKSLYPHLQRFSSTEKLEQEVPEAIAPSSDPRIPSSSFKTHAVSHDPSIGDASVSRHNSSAPCRFSTFVDATPSHRPSKFARSVSAHRGTAYHDKDELSQASPALPTLAGTQQPLKPSQPFSRISSLESPLRRYTPADTPSRRSLRQISLGIVASIPTSNNRKSPKKRHITIVSKGSTPGTILPGSDANAEQAPHSSLEAKPFLQNTQMEAIDMEKIRNTSIYEALGWENEIDELT
ncbi:hypothetical protein MMC13_004564 [Lambiella insularis]|nr:hypothetical protein [Lambiella insularis]